MTEELFHFTCAHGHARIGDRGKLRPQVPHPFLGCRVVWLTDQPSPDREATGLGMTYTRCDRMAYRYVVTDTSRCRPWLSSPERAVAPARAVDDLERYGDPQHWWIASEPVTARLA